MTSSADTHFPELDVVNQSLAEQGADPLFISIFDHWLSEHEADCCNVMTFSLAEESGALEGYLDGERRFLQLYRLLASDGALVNHPSRSRGLHAPCAKLDEIFIASLRETCLMDIYFPGYGVRILGGYDRTDAAIWIVLRTEPEC